MSAVGIFGPWRGGNEERVRGWMRSLYAAEPDDVIVSGGEAQPGSWAEQEWLSLGGKVVSFRPIRVQTGTADVAWDEFRIERWDLGVPEPSRRTLEEYPVFARIDGARAYRDMLIAETVDKAVGFFSPRDLEQSWVRDIFFAQNKPIYVFEEG